MTATAYDAPRRHCMVVHAYYPLGETRVQRQASALTDGGYQVDVLCLRAFGEPCRERVQDVNVIRLPVRRHRGRGLAVQLLEYVAFFVLATMVLSVRHLRHRYDVVQVHNLPDFLIFSALLPKLMGASCILDLHDLMPEFFASKIAAGMNHPLVRLLILQEQIACRFADHVITVTAGWRDALVDRGTSPDRVSVVMNVPDSRVFTAPHRVTPHVGSRFELLYHGTFAHHYGVDLILDAVALVRDDLPNVHLTLLGDGELRPTLLEQCRTLDLEDLVDISEGMVDVESLPAAIVAADAGVVPTRPGVFTDGLLPTKLMEFVAMHTPVIAARTPMVTSYFDDDMVQFFTPGDVRDLAAAIRRLAGDAERRRVLVERAETFNRTHEWETIAASYVALVERASPPRRSQTSRIDDVSARAARSQEQM